MAKMIQIWNVPDDLHRKLKVRAAQEGMTLSDYLLSEVEKVALPSPRTPGSPAPPVFGPR